MILGVARLSKIHGMKAARFTVLISDPYQGVGLGAEFLHRMIRIAHAEKLERIEAYTTADNIAMQHMVEKQGFEVSLIGDGKLLRAELSL